MAFSPSSYFSDTSTDSSLLSPVQNHSTNKLDDFSQPQNPKWRDGEDPSTVTGISSPVQDRSDPNPADHDHQWDPSWREQPEEQHLYIFNRLPPPEGMFITDLFIILSRFGRILDVTTFEGMEYDNLTRRFPCYAIRMGITHSDPNDEDYALDVAKQIMVELRNELGVHAIVERVLASEMVPGLDEPLGPDPEEANEQTSSQAPPRPQRPRTPLVQDPLEESGSPRHDNQAHHHCHGNHEGGSRRFRLKEALRLRVEKHKRKHLRGLSDSSHKRDGEE